jgi:hypothetical protein
MLIPRDIDEKNRLYRNLVRQCSISVEDRRSQNRRYRQWFLTGSDANMVVRYNKLREHVADSAADIYAPEAVRFGVSLPPEHNAEEWIDELEAERDALNRLWHDPNHGHGLTFGMGVEWAHVWPTAIFKVIVSDGRPSVELIPDPADVGVLREGVHSWSRQEAICHWYVLDLPSFRRMVGSHPQRELLMAKAAEHAGRYSTSGSSDVLPSAVNRLVLAQATPSMIGAVQAIADSALATPREMEDVVRIAELWVKDDRARVRVLPSGVEEYVPEWRVVTILLPEEIVLWDPLNPLIAGQHAFHPLTLEPTPGYLWGLSPLDGLLMLQAWRETRMNQLDALMEKQADPPIAAIGLGGIADEKVKALRRAGGIFTSAMPQGEVKPFIVPMPPDMFAEVQEIDKMFAQRAGRPLGLRGQTEPGVRSGDQAMAQAMLGSGPTLTKAMRVEACLAAVATALLRLERRISSRPLRKRDGTEVLPSQIPSDLIASVIAHSASPLYAQQVLEKVAFASMRNAIDSETLIRALNLPDEYSTVVKGRRISKNMADAAQQEMQLKEREVAAKEMKAASK